MHVPFRYKAQRMARVAQTVWYDLAGNSARRRVRGLRDRGDASLPRFFGLSDTGLVPIPSEERARIRRVADAASRGEISLVGLGLVACGVPPDWHRDPVSGRRFPNRWLDTQRDRDIDWRFCDELNLHRHLYPLAQAAYLSGDERFVDTVVQHVADWWTANPPIPDRFWHSALQCAVRAVAWLWALSLLRARGALPPEMETLFYDALHEHGCFIERHASRPPGAYNHIIGEWAALVLIGIAVPSLPLAQRWRERGLDILTREATRQFADDGAHREQSTGYHVFVLEAYTHVVLLARHNDVSLDPTIAGTLERMYECVMRMMRPDGRLPSFGDEAMRWHALSAAPLHDARRLLSTGATIFQRPDMKRVAGAFSPESTWLLGSKGQESFAALGSEAPPPSGVLTGAGLVVMRTGWEADAAYLAFDAGAHGVGRAGHGHADALSVELCVNGTPLLVDSGTFTYSGQSEWRNVFRGTAAHNTVRVDAQDQVAASAEPFAWTTSLSVSLEQTYFSPQLSYATAAHDGYRRLPGAVEHRRAVFWVAREYWVVCDILGGTGEHLCETFWHFPADSAVDAHAGGHLARRQAATLFVGGAADADVQTRVIRGGMDPRNGWFSDTYGSRQPAPVLIESRRIVLPRALPTVLVPNASTGDTPARVRTIDVTDGGHNLSVSQAACVAVSHGGDREDYLLWAEKSGSKQAGDLVTDAFVALIRVSDTEVSGTAIGGTHLSWRGQPVSAGKSPHGTAA